MAFIQVHQSLRDHHKILELAALLDMPEAHVAGHCVFLWLWSLDNAPDGLLPKAERAIESRAGWMGEPGAFIAAMVTVGMLDRDEDGRLHIHDWDAYTGKLMESRKANAERQQRWRERHNEQDVTPRNTPVTSRNAGVTVTYPLRNDVEKRREEKTREEREIATDAAIASPSRPQTPALSLVKPQEPDIASEQESETPPTPAARPPKARSVNPLWDALVVALSYEPTTRPARSNWGKAVKDLTEAGATPDEIALRAGRIVTRWGREYLTINALVTHWSEPGIATDAPLSTAIRASPASADSGPRFVTADHFDPWKKTAAARGETR